MKMKGEEKEKNGEKMGLTKKTEKESEKTFLHCHAYAQQCDRYGCTRLSGMGEQGF